MRLLRRLSPFQQPQSGETIIGEGKAEVEQTDGEDNHWLCKVVLNYLYVREKK